MKFQIDLLHPLWLSRFRSTWLLARQTSDSMCWLLWLWWSFILFVWENEGRNNCWMAFLSCSSIFFCLFRYWTNEKTTKDQGRGGLASGATSVGGARHLPSNYHQLKRVCRDRGLLFDDPEFPTTARSLYTNKKPTNLGGPITWLRPHVILNLIEHFFIFWKNKNKTEIT